MNQVYDKSPLAVADAGNPRGSFECSVAGAAEQIVGGDERSIGAPGFLGARSSAVSAG
ncbi:hypothetical protein sS8_0088 [Methylocaldum marinum]|uniref:Uncharacterized protein n=1 Tax=Methylocaldum marinum TaxID=1432792 RepID=A0A286T783_9GAMM|nr:hypothetical protein sS8_0088 [Methylocaldum marinum]